MKHTYHVITPLTRFGNLPALIDMMRPQRVVWHVIMDADTPFRLSFGQNWIMLHVCPNTETAFWQRCNFSINWLLDLGLLEPDDRYCFLNDDDAYEPGFFEKIDQHDGEVLIASMKRGQHTPTDARPESQHGTNTLIAAPENMTPGAVGVEQIIMSGRVLKDVRLPLAVDGDGRMIQWVCANHPVTYVPDAYVLFNFFEPGRWDHPNAYENRC